MAVSGEDAVKAINGVFGCYDGSRAAHARGTVCRGVFTPTHEAAELTRAQHMHESVDVTARFSNASGDPGTRDAEPDARGLAVKFHLPEGSDTDIVAVTLPCFFVRTLEDFIQLNHRLRRSPGGRPPSKPGTLVRLGSFAYSHREARKATVAVLRSKPVPSYANCSYNAIHAFKWTDGSEPCLGRYVRYRWRPEAGESTLPRRDAKNRARDYLQEDLHNRLGREPVQPIRFMLELQIASTDDLRQGRVCDPTSVWPGDRTKKEDIVAPDSGTKSKRYIDAGLLELTGLDDGTGETGEQLAFNPMNLTDGIEAPSLPAGIEPSRDEILEFRPQAYAFSIKRRAGKVPCPR
jgi:catalase